LQKLILPLFVHRRPTPKCHLASTGMAVVAPPLLNVHISSYCADVLFTSRQSTNQNTASVQKRRIPLLS
jgi:hypothetical protein